MAVTVAYETLDGTAVAGVDYTSMSGTLRFDAGETRTTLAVPTLEDATAEETEGFTVQLSEPAGATVADGTATGTITDDDEPPGLSIDDAPAVREGETAAFVVRLSAASGAAVTVAYETLDGTAVAGVDYTSMSGTLRFDAGETRTTLAVPTLEDATAEETEGFTVQLSEPAGATVADGTATGTITDDDEPPGLSIDDAPAVREGETAAFVVRLSAASGAAVTVAYETLDGTAAAGVRLHVDVGDAALRRGRDAHDPRGADPRRRHGGRDRRVHGAAKRAGGSNGRGRDSHGNDHRRR